MRAYNFGGSGRNLTKLYHGTWLIAGMITWTLILEWVPPTKFGRVKTSKIQRDFELSIFDREYLSGTDRHIENRKST